MRHKVGRISNWAIFGIILTLSYQTAASDEIRLLAQFCGKINVVGPVNTNGINSFLDTQLQFISIIRPESPSKNWIGKIVPCNVPGDEFQVCRSCQDKITQEQMSAILPMLTSKSHRLWHGYWHRMWKLANEIDFEPAFDILTADQVDEDNLESLNVLTESGWLPKHRASRFLSKTKDHRGESFLYMHRQMIKMVNFELTANGLACIEPWRKILPADDKIWPAPILLKAKGNKQLIAETIDANKSLQETFAKLGQREHLRTITLNQLAIEIAFEYDFHADLHEFYADDEETTAAHCKGDETTSKTCDDLTSNISSQANKHFWKLHGLIDDLIGKWLDANGYSLISENCQGKDKCYQWKGTYLGKVPQ